MKKRLLAAMPMISLFLFLGAGLFLENWQLGWTFFLLIPLSWVLLTGKPLKRLNESMPLICLVVFLWLGFGFDLWHPGWMVFLLIPLVNLMVERKLDARKIVGILVTAAYIAIGLLFDDMWHPTWIMFLLIPIINTIFFPQKFAYVSFNSTTLRHKFRDIIDYEDEEDNINTNK